MNPYQDDFYFQNMMRQQNSNNYIPSNQAMMRNKPFVSIANKMNFQTMLQGTTKTVSTINQVVPLVYQVTPIINNARNAFRVFRAISTLSAIDLSEIDAAVIVDDTSENQIKEETLKQEDQFDSTQTIETVQPEQNNQEVFENML